MIEQNYNEKRKCKISTIYFTHLIIYKVNLSMGKLKLTTSSDWQACSISSAISLILATIFVSVRFVWVEMQSGA